uniref:Retrotransposon gag domain-containing protein n=1 Tax=Chromera velia CCMP2878 TaxID=1169474 RepID=A0A0K6S9Y0_9ALVE|eukprot:Cvel_30820.t2-p1 / transcript=Cvel_30820.t2 / gene=Cvel_30820 / organism=Chromera_velia_CCMP2878 / gene_product=hypothetical protein / transcript_product=hypothetical protein / location=Cvel_scaffold4473:3196-5719(+) / protein_length=641 / sequence_SO=supercontig / SO=protein_coding / is_pseudo=false
MDLVGNPQAQAALQKRFEQLLNRVQQLSVIAEHQQQEIAELKAQLGHQSFFAQSSFQSHSGDVLHPSPPPSVKPKKPEIFLEKAEDVDTWIALWQNLYHITKTPPEEQAPIAVTYLSPTLQVKLAEEARAEGIPITSLQELKEALYRSFPDPNVQETLRSEIRQICAKKGVWDYTDEFRGIARRLTDVTQTNLMYDYKAGLPKAVSDEIGRGRRQPPYGQSRNSGQRPPWRWPGVRPARLEAEEDEYEDEYWGDEDEERERDADLRDDARRHGESPVRATGEREDDAWVTHGRRLNDLHCNHMHSFPQRLPESRDGEAHETDHLRSTAAPLQREALRESDGPQKPPGTQLPRSVNPVASVPFENEYAAPTSFPSVPLQQTRTMNSTAVQKGLAGRREQRPSRCPGDGRRRPVLMRLRGMVNGTPVTILFDPGADENYMSASFAHSHGLPVRRFGRPTDCEGALAEDPSHQVSEYIPTDGCRLKIDEYEDQKSSRIDGPITVREATREVRKGAPFFLCRLERIEREEEETEDERERREEVGEVEVDPRTKEGIQERKPPFCEYEKVMASSSLHPAAREILKENKELFPDEIPKLLPKRGDLDFKIELEPGARPPAKLPYRLSYAELEEMKKQLKDYVDRGFI